MIEIPTTAARAGVEESQGTVVATDAPAPTADASAPPAPPTALSAAPVLSNCGTGVSMDELWSVVSIPPVLAHDTIYTVRYGSSGASLSKGGAAVVLSMGVCNPHPHTHHPCACDSVCAQLRGHTCLGSNLAPK